MTMPDHDELTEEQRAVLRKALDAEYGTEEDND